MASTLGANIKALRQARSLTQVELGGKLHKAGSTVRMWELGKAYPDTDTLIALSQVFNVSTDYLLSNADIQPRAEEAPPTPKEKQIGRISKGLAQLNQKQLRLVDELVREISHSDEE